MERNVTILAPVLDLKAGADLKRILLAAQGPLVIDANAVQRIASSVLQVIAAAALARPIAILAPSPAFADAVRDLGLAETLFLPESDHV